MIIKIVVIKAIIIILKAALLLIEGYLMFRK